MTATPKEYASRYRSLKTKFEDGSTETLAASKYRIGLKDESTKDQLWNKIKKHFKDEKTLKVTVFVGGSATSTEHTFQSRDELRYAALNAFWGKASPEEMQVTLQLLDRFSIKNKIDLSAYCAAANIGVDCSGFVGNYIARVLRGKVWTEQVANGAVGPHTKSNAIFKKYTRVTEVEQLKLGQRYVLAYCSASGVPHGSSPTGHVVISNAATMAQLQGRCHITAGDSVARLTISESTGGIGVVTSEYQIREIKKKGTDKAFFRVYRGSKKKHINMAVAKVRP